MTKLSKATEPEQAPQEFVLEEVVETEAPEANRASTPPPLEEGSVSPRIREQAYEQGLTPKYEESESENSDEESSDEAQSDADDEKEETLNEKDDQGLAPWIEYHHKSGPITLDDVPKSKETKIVEKPQEDRLEDEYPKDIPKKAKDAKASKRKFKENPKEDATQEVPRLNPKDLFKLQQQLLAKIRHEQSLKEVDNRALVLAMHSQMASLSGSVDQMSTAFDKVTSRLTLIHGHGLTVEETTTRGFAKLDELVNNAWRSQGRNRASIDTNNGLLKELVKSLESQRVMKESVPQGTKNPQDSSSWMFPTYNDPLIGSPRPAFSVSQGQPIFQAPHASQEQSVPVSQGYHSPMMQGISGLPVSQGSGARPDHQQRYYEEQKGCRYCMASHVSLKCPVVRTWQDRRRILLDQKACFYCLEQGACRDGKPHAKCASLPPCRKCHIMYPYEADMPKRHHHFSICETVKPTPLPSTKEESQPPAKKARPSVKKESSTKKFSKHADRS